MRESKEGVVRLEMLNEFVLRDILEFIYTLFFFIRTSNFGAEAEAERS